MTTLNNGNEYNKSVDCEEVFLEVQSMSSQCILNCNSQLYMDPATNIVSHVMCHVTHITCHVSQMCKKTIFFTQTRFAQKLFNPKKLINFSEFAEEKYTVNISKNKYRG